MTHEGREAVDLDAIEDALSLLDAISHCSPCCARSVAVRMFQRIAFLIARQSWDFEPQLDAAAAMAADLLGVPKETVADAVEFFERRLASEAETVELERALRIGRAAECPSPSVEGGD